MDDLNNGRELLKSTHFLKLDPNTWVFGSDRLIVLPVKDVLVSLAFQPTQYEKHYYYLHLQALPLFVPSVTEIYEVLGHLFVSGSEQLHYLGQDVKLTQQTVEFIQKDIEPLIKPLTDLEALLHFLLTSQRMLHSDRSKEFVFFILMRLQRFKEAKAYLNEQYWPMFKFESEAFRDSKDRARDFIDDQYWVISKREELLFYESLIDNKDYDRINTIFEAVKIRNIFQFRLNAYHRIV